MATILGGDIQVDYLASNRQKRLSWAGTTGTYTINQIYSAMATLLDESTTIDDGTCFSAETPREYTIGQIDTGDTEPWYITFDLMEHVTGGALRTSGWTRATGTNTGIIVVPVATTGTITTTDQGYTVTGATTGSGTLLEFINTGGTYDYLVIRPAGSTAPSDFTTASQVITSSRGAFTATQWATASSTTGEMIWAGLYSLGTIDPNVHQYLYQGSVDTDGNRVRLFSWNDATQDWLDNYATNGHIDTTVALKDIEVATWSIIDGGYVTVLARKYGDYYASFEVACSTTSGGYNPVPLGTATDIDNTTGIKNITYTVGAGTFVVGDIILGGTSGARGLVTAVNTGPASLGYIPIDDAQKAFTAAEAISAGATTGTGIGAPTSVGPALNTWFTSNVAPTLTFTHTTADIDDDATNENYGIVIDCNANPLTEVYEWVKYVTRNGATTGEILTKEGINGEDYIGAEVYLSWTGAVTGTIAQGGNVSQAGSGATGVIISYDVTAKYMLLRDTRGTFNTTGLVTDNDNSGTVTPDASISTFAPKTASPLGTFAGGTFFGARGVLLTDYLATDANSFILVPAAGGTKARPASFTITVSNLVGGAATSNLHDKVAVFRLTGAGADINKTEYSVAGIQAIGANTLVTGAITQDTPGKTTGGLIILVDVSNAGTEYKLRYSSWSGSTFTLNEITGTATGGSTTTLINTSATFQDGADQVYRGDLVTVTGKGSAHVLTVDSQTQLTMESAFTSAVANLDTYEINTLPVATTASDKAYVPFIHEVATSATATQSVIYVAQVYYRGKVRNTRATTKIKPFSVDGTTTGGDVAIATIRTTDTIIT
ncbi:hypothetical protein KKA27_04200 [Patescibacteria group bacterium]|nr:hypothetical protein [Patescibacteria group bacterium]